MKSNIEEFEKIYFFDFEFSSTDGNTPKPICLVANELKSNTTIKLFLDRESHASPPYHVGDDCLFVSYYATAEISCHLALSWPVPQYVLDLFAEFRCLTNGKHVYGGNSLLGAMSFFNLDAIAASEKDEMRELAIRGGPFSSDEKEALLEYCESDVVSLKSLFNRMCEFISVPHALLRGAYMCSLAKVEFTGVPIDRLLLDKLISQWGEIKLRLIERIDKDFGVFEGATFKQARFRSYLAKHEIRWPRLPSGNLSLDDETFKEMAQLFPQLNPLRELRTTLSQMKLLKLSVGKDGRNRCMLSPFRSKTSRNQPSNTKFIYGPSRWVRSFIKPEYGKALAYVDFEQQEFAVAASLSGDQDMVRAYESGDPYLAFAKQAGLVPENATKESHKFERNRCKVCSLGVLYGMGVHALAFKLGSTASEAKTLLKLHRKTYPKFWSWSRGVVTSAQVNGYIETVYGWRLNVRPGSNDRMLVNFPMQGNSAEILRIAIILATENGIKIAAPVHDALLIESNEGQIEADIETTIACMQRASELVLDGFRLRCDVEVVEYPNRYVDERGAEMWDAIMGLLKQDHKSSPKMGEQIGQSVLPV